ncbi:hypothetical protein ACR9YC_07085 [Parasphingorhabdus sp. DH2-15]|uniref:hypothetical protein n=1 Tax=Parasphingorhabdus sp. DH2-15 TaxID=3444112 RepID=UPI003F684771
MHINKSYTSFLLGIILATGLIHTPRVNAKKGTWVSRESVISSDTTRPQLIFALQAGNWEEANALGRQGSFFGIRGVLEQRNFLKTHLRAMRFMCPALAEVAPPSFAEGNAVEFSGNRNRGTARYSWRNAAERNAVLDAEVLVQEVGCGALPGYAGNVYHYLRGQTD